MPEGPFVRPGPPHYTRCDGFEDLPRHALRWSQPHDVNEHVAGSRESCAPSVIRWSCSRRRTALEIWLPAGGRFSTARRGRGDGRPGVPISRAAESACRSVRVRTCRSPSHSDGSTSSWLRAGAPFAFVSGAARRAGHDRGDVSECRTARYHPGERNATDCSDGSTRWSQPARRRRRQQPTASGRYRSSAKASSRSSSCPGTSDLIVLEWRPNERALLRGVFRALEELPDWELLLLRTSSCGRPTIRVRCAIACACGRHGRGCASTAARRDEHLRPCPRRARARAARSIGVRVRSRVSARRPRPTRARRAEVARLAEDPSSVYGKPNEHAPTPKPELRDVARELDELYRSLSERRHAPPRSTTRLPIALGALRPPHAHELVKRLPSTPPT